MSSTFSHDIEWLNEDKTLGLYMPTPLYRDAYIVEPSFLTEIKQWFTERYSGWYTTPKHVRLEILNESELVKAAVRRKMIAWSDMDKWYLPDWMNI